MTATTDTLGRATFHHIRHREDVQPTARELRWFKHIERHGPQSSELLHELTCDTHRCKDSALREMQKLRAGGLMRLPQQQLAIERAPFHPYIYDLTNQATDYMAGCGLAEPAIRPTGHWWHSYSVSAFTGSRDILARSLGQEFIPAHRILKRPGADLAIPVSDTRLIPDQFFAIRYVDGYRAFLLEVDRGTEPHQSAQTRKSLTRSIDLYVEMFAKDLHYRHYGHKAMTLCVWVFQNPIRLRHFLELIQRRAPRFTAYFLCKLLPEKMSVDGLRAMHERPWVTGNGHEFPSF